MARQESQLRWAALIVGLATVLAYAPALRGPFLYDDGPSIPDNASIRQLWPLAVPLNPPAQAAISGRPVVNYSLALNFALNTALGIDQRPDPDGPYKTVSYHAVNLLIHLICGALLFGVLRRTVRRQRYDPTWAEHADWLSLGVTALWLLSPIQTEAVDYVIQRTELMVSVCYLGTLYASIRGWDAATVRARLGWYGAAVVLCVLGMGSKEVMVSAPLVVVLYDVAFDGTGQKKTDSPERGSVGLRAAYLWAQRGWFYVALFATSSVLIGLIATGARSATVGFNLGIPWYQYLYTQAWAILHYVRLFLWPNRLTIDYGQAPIRGLRGLPGLLVLSAFGVATVLAWTRVQRWGWFAFLGSWFFLLLAPSSSVVPIASEVAAERRVYLALAPVIVLVLVVLSVVWRRLAGRFAGLTPTWPGPRAWFGAGLTACGLLLATATFQRSRLYADEVGIWRDAVEKVPDNPRASMNLEDALMRRDSLHVEEPERLLDHVLSQWPNDRVALARLGVIYQQQGEPARAIPYFEHVVAMQSRSPYLLNLGIAYADVGRLNDAASALRAALQIDPRREITLNRLGAVLLALGQPSDAAPYLETAVQEQPGSGLSLALLSRAYAESGHTADATAAASYALARAGDSPEALTALGDAEVALGKRDVAAGLYERALRARRDYAPALQGLARLGRPG